MTPQEAKELVDAGKRIYGWWRQIADAMRPSKGRILFTGMNGVGKTTLFDYMTGNAYVRGYLPPGKSHHPEKGKLNTPGHTLGMLVLPGQNSTTRFEAAQSSILGKHPPEGIIHVVANGFATVRGETSERLNESRKWKTLAAMQRWRRALEVEELKQVCEWIRQSHKKHRKPMWLLLVVTKYDLFASDLGVKNEYYPGGHGAIVSMLDELTRQVGSDNFAWQASASCSWLEPFRWKEEIVPSQLDAGQRDALIEELIKHVLTFCSAAGERR